jgi:hypothetical protein
MSILYTLIEADKIGDCTCKKRMLERQWPSAAQADQSGRFFAKNARMTGMQARTIWWFTNIDGICIQSSHPSSHGNYHSSNKDSRQ